jgi:hypothetical protein
MNAEPPNCSPVCFTTAPWSRTFLRSRLIMSSASKKLSTTAFTTFQFLSMKSLRKTGVSTTTG